VYFLAYAVVGLVLIMIFSFVRGTDKFEDFCVGFFMVLFLTLLFVPTVIETAARPNTVDGLLRRIDLGIGLDGFAFSRAVWSIAWVRLILRQVYWGMPAVFALAWSLERSRALVRGAWLGALLVFPFYLLVPACGPAYAFRGWPDASAVLVSTVGIYAPRNCMPSMHFAWALLLLINAHGRIWKIAMWIYCALIGITTVAGGEHYFIDLIAAVPFAFGVQYLAERPHAIREWLSIPALKSGASSSAAERPKHLKGEIEKQ
jgi:hypothetical protein